MIVLTQFPVAPPKIVAIATEPGLQPKYAFADRDLPGLPPQYGEDLTFGLNGIPPNGEDVGSTEDELKPKMERLLDTFAAGDDSGMAHRLFNAFVAKQSQITLFTDKDLDKAAAAHENIQSFCLAAWGAPYPFGIEPPPGKTRIHQALQAANWDISKLVAPTDLGAPAFDLGKRFSKFWLSPTGDWLNGLAFMIDAVQYVYVIATHYVYAQDVDWYFIRLKYIGYDVFGLDNDDLTKFGSKRDGLGLERQLGAGITAWWQLQHQHAYAPLVTRFVVEQDLGCPTKRIL